MGSGAASRRRSWGEERLSITIQQLLTDMVNAGASDLHVKAGNVPGFRIDGEIQFMDQYPRLTPEMTADLCRQLMSHEQWERFQKEHDLDFSYAVRDLARFRINAMTQRSA